MLANWNELVSQAMSARPRLDLPRNFKLPCIPQSVIEFTAISKNPNAGPNELAAPIEVDAVLTSGLLRQVNSAAVGLRQTINSVRQAINLLGPRRTKTLVLTSALQSATATTSSRLINIAQLQRANRVRGMYARRTAMAIGADAETAYLAGLLQDFLLPLLTGAFAAEYEDALRQDNELAREEERLFGWNHAQVAAGLMHDWGFPDELVLAVLFHHDSQRIVADEVLRTTSVGATVAAAALPIGPCPSPTGFETLLELQNALPDFNFLDVADEVDRELNGGDTLFDNQDGLYDQLSKLAEASLEERRAERMKPRRQLGSYILESQIGQGSMGTIYLARHCMLKRLAAIKVLRTSNIGPTSLALFETEVQLTCRLTSPHTVAVYDYGVTPEGLFYYAMEYLDGVTLAQLVEAGGPLPAGRVIHFLRQVCGSLTEAHALGLIHRDLKPENIIVCDRGGIPDTIKVLDFGVATVVNSATRPDRVSLGITGTPNYMSPESITAPQHIDCRSDLYSVGGIGFFLLTGHAVFTGGSVQAVLQSQILDKPKRPSEILGSPIDADLENVVLQCLSKSRDDRPATAEELHRLLGQCQAFDSWNPQDARRLPAPGNQPAPFARADLASNGVNDTLIVPIEA